MADEKFYSLIADELEHKKTDRVLWTRALGESGGDLDKTSAVYIRLRLADLKKKAAAEAPALALEPAVAASPAPSLSDPPPSNALLRLRSELAEALRDNGKSSFYSLLQITPLATDAEVAAAIARYEDKVEAGLATATPEFKYAKDSLGTARAREAYDRRLFASTTADAGPLSRPAGRGSYEPVVTGSDSLLLHIWESRKATVIVGALSLCIVGYMLLGFYKEREASAMRKKEIEAQILQTQKNAENDAIRAEAEKALANGVVTHAGTAIDRTTQMGNRALELQRDAENRRRFESEQQAIANAQRLEMQREAQERQLAMQEQRTRESKRQMDDRRAEREKRYWACMNTALDRNSETTANARCAGYR
jgi:hypothetical protein